MIEQAHIFVNNRHLCDMPVHLLPDRLQAYGVSRSNRAVICPYTGQIWARVLRDDSEDKLWSFDYQPAEGQPNTRSFRAHGQVPGSLLDDGVVPGAFMPYAFLLREFLVHVEFFKRELARYHTGEVNGNEKEERPA